MGKTKKILCKTCEKEVSTEIPYDTVVRAWVVCPECIVADKEQEAWYKQGLIDAVTAYAVWKDGEQFVGVMREPLRKVIDRINQTGKL